jgi:hypothetical protein
MMSEKELPALSAIDCKDKGQGMVTMDGSVGCGCEQEIRNQVAKQLKRALYKELAELHSGCEFQDSPENLCNCDLAKIVEIAQG